MDTHLPVWQTFAMLRQTFLVSLLCLSSTGLLAQQQPAVSSPTPASVKPAADPLQTNPAKFTEAVRSSYYHPDDLSGIACDVSIDWASFFSTLKVTVPPERLKAVQGLKTHVQATRGKLPEYTFDWAGGVIDKKDQMEDSVKQMVSGFYQMYWNMIAAFPVQSTAEVKTIEPQADGGAKVYISDQNSSVVVTTSPDHVPTHYSFDSPLMKGVMDTTYTPSPNPVPGDLRRLTDIHVSQQIGASTMNVSVSLDYQQMGGYYIPQHVTFGLSNTYSIKLSFSGCSVSKTILVVPPKK